MREQAGQPVLHESGRETATLWASSRSVNAEQAELLALAAVVAKALVHHGVPPGTEFDVEAQVLHGL